MDRIKRTAKVFRHKGLKGKVNYDTIKECLQKMGYSIIFYDVNDDFALLNKYGIDTKELNANAFTLCTGEFQTVFINSKVTSDNVIYSLLHEVGHILLKHLEQDGTYPNVRLQDMQADAFAYEVLNYKSKKHIYIIVVMIFLILFGFCMGVHRTSQSEMVYVTSSGTKYHRETCIYVYGKECSALTVEQAKKNYTPCKVCNP